MYIHHHQASSLSQCHFSGNSMNSSSMENLHSHATSISPLSEQWSTLQNSFSLLKTLMADRVKLIESKEREILEAAKSLEFSLKEVELLENSVNQRLKEVQMREEQLNEKIHAFEVKVTETDELSKEMEVKRCEMAEMKATMMEEKRVMEGEIEERRKVVEERENEMDERCRVLDCREKVLNERSQDLVMKFKEFDERRKVLEMEERELREALLELKAKQSKEVTTSAQAKTRELQPVACSELQLLCRNMDTNGMRSYLIKHYKDIHMMLSKISDSLQLAPDPAKLVLNVIQSFYELVKSENMPRQVYFASCIALSGALMKLNTSITLHIKDDAMKFSTMWRDFSAKQGYTRSQLMEIFAFLQFLASFKLAQSYDEDELFSLLGNFYTESEVRWPEKDSYLCRILGLKKKIPGFIRSLIKRDEHLRAVVYICAFKLEGAFPPVPLLKAHLECIQKRVQEMLKKDSDRAQNDAVNMEKSALRVLINCISNFKIESSFSPAPLELRIKQLEKEIEGKTSAES